MCNFTTEITIKNPRGLHLRVAGMVAKSVNKHKSTATLSCNGKMADCLSPLAITSLAATKNTRVLLCVDGEDANQAGPEIQAILEDEEL